MLKRGLIYLGMAPTVLVRVIIGVAVIAFGVQSILWLADLRARSITIQLPAGFVDITYRVGSTSSKAGPTGRVAEIKFADGTTHIMRLLADWGPGIFLSLYAFNDGSYIVADCTGASTINWKTKAVSDLRKDNNPASPRYLGSFSGPDKNGELFFGLAETMPLEQLLRSCGG